ncbi:MAG: FKBP-type peptidyl-prolyl cis-trans isomerase [Armatimonadota bacterium]|nr:FKBP-type peptidyl-prolyl cis-trans isomerase [Armatimonadota bacterium]
MKRRSYWLVLLLLPALFAGCSRKLEQTTATQVHSPPDKPTPVSTAPKSDKQSLAKAVDLRKFKTTASGVKYHDLRVGRGALAEPNCRVTVHYKGWLKDGTLFDSSLTRGEPYTFTLGTGEVIRGWDEGIRGMRVGGVRQLIVPPKLGYGGKAVGRIPPNSTLYFEVQLLAVSK